MTIFERGLIFLADMGIMGAPPGAGAESAEPGAVVETVVQNVPPPEAAPGGLSWGLMIVIYGAIFVGMYFIFFRPQRTREKKMREMQAAISTGDNIITSGGLFGKVADVGEDCFIVDFGTNRSIRIPVLKGDVVGVREPKMTPPPKIAVE